jgi:dolichol-phosphate mannosyltransferase
MYDKCGPRHRTRREFTTTLPTLGHIGATVHPEREPVPAPAVATPDVSVVVMTYNEAESLADVVREIRDELAGLDATYEVLVVDDGSNDGSATVADTLAADDARIRVIHHQANAGLGGVYRTGFTQSRGRYLTFFPADGQFPARIIGQFLPLMQNHDLVLGYIPQTRTSMVGKFLSATERILYTLLFGGFPRFQGIMMLRRELLHELRLVSTGRGWAIVMEFILRASHGGYRIASEPTAYRPRMHGTSKVNNLRSISSNFTQLLALRCRMWGSGTADFRTQDPS